MPKVFAGKGVHPGEAFCLRLLAKNDGISQHDLADIVHLSRPRVTKILQTLQKEGAIVRRADENDQRLTRVFLTDDGRRREMELRTIFESYLNEIIGALTDADRFELERLLNMLSDRISHVLEAEEPTGR
jgi:MarR family transcriptional regulator, organic hydroperoxide resistance regulator